MRIANKTTFIAALTAATICLIVYLRALSCDFVNFDDQEFIVGNSAIRHLDGNLLVWAFTKGLDIWIPLTWLSFAVDYHFWQLNPMGYHLTNILLHAVNTAVVVLIADRLLRREPGLTSGTEGIGDQQRHPYCYPAMLLLAGLLWGIHPLRVESVAWATERKDVLNGVFSLSTILFYLRHTQQTEAAGSRAIVTRDYLLSLTLFLLSLMAKPVSVVIPAMLLVADWYPLGRLRKENLRLVLVEKIPYVVLSATVAGATIFLAAHKHILASASSLSIGQRFIISGNAVFEYCRLLLYPAGILPLHILPFPIPPAFAVKTAAVALITCCCIYAGKKYRFVPATWFSFVIPLLPVLGLLQNGSQAFAARYSYLPSVVPCIVAAALIAVAYRKLVGGEKRYPRFLAAALIVALLLFYAGMTQRHINIWNNSGALWTRVIDYQPLGRAYKSRGAYYLANGDYPAAIRDFTAAIDIAVGYEMREETFNLFAGRGAAYGNEGQHENAVKDFSTAIELYPHPLYYYHRGLSLQALGKENEAARDFERAGGEEGPIVWFKMKYGEN